MYKQGNMGTENRGRRRGKKTGECVREKKYEKEIQRGKEKWRVTD